MREARFDRLRVLVGASTEEMASRAASDFAEAVRERLAGAREVNIAFAGAESQAGFHAALRARRDIDWKRVHAFAVDEFWSPGMRPECAVSAQPRRDLYSAVMPCSVTVVDYAAPDPQAECRRYATLVERRPPDICCLGIGVSGHIALNEPGDTDFADTRTARVVRLLPESKRQLASDPNFRSLPAIPDQGITLTIPFLMRAARLFVVVPFLLKAEIVARLQAAAVTPALPSSILKARDSATLYLDPGSASRLSALP